MNVPDNRTMQKQSPENNFQEALEFHCGDEIDNVNDLAVPHRYGLISIL